SAARAHPLLEPTDRTEREVGAPDTGDDPPEDHVAVPREEDADPDRVGRARVFAHGTNAKTPAGVEEPDEHHHDDHEQQVHEDVVVEQDGTDEWDLRQDGKGDVLEAARVVERLVLLEVLLGEVRVETESEDVDHRPGHDLIDEVTDRQHREKGGMDSPSDRSDEQSYPQASCDDARTSLPY